VTRRAPAESRGSGGSVLCRRCDGWRVRSLRGWNLPDRIRSAIAARVHVYESCSRVSRGFDWHARVRVCADGSARARLRGMQGPCVADPFDHLNLTILYRTSRIQLVKWFGMAGTGPGPPAPGFGVVSKGARACARRRPAQLGFCIRMLIWFREQPSWLIYMLIRLREQARGECVGAEARGCPPCFPLPPSLGRRFGVLAVRPRDLLRVEW
jgi:hypothetical protein